MIELLKKIIREEGEGNLNFLTDIYSCADYWGLEVVEEGDSWFVIYSKELNQYVKCTGRYNYADEGIEYAEDCFKLVTPIQKMVTVYV
jgi:hypothetical protein